MHPDPGRGFSKECSTLRNRKTASGGGKPDLDCRGEQRQSTRPCETLVRIHSTRGHVRWHRRQATERSLLEGRRERTSRAAATLCPCRRGQSARTWRC